MEQVKQTTPCFLSSSRARARTDNCSTFTDFSLAMAFIERANGNGVLFFVERLARREKCGAFVRANFKFFANNLKLKNDSSLFESSAL